MERHENFRSSKREGQWRAYRKKWRRYICYKKMREIKRLFKSWNQFQNEIDTLVPKLMGINSHQKTYLRSKVFMPCSVELGFWKKSQQCTFFLISNFVILTLQYTINFNPPGKETAFPVLWTSAVEKLHNFRNLNLMKFLNVQQSQNFFGARRTYKVRAPSVTIELDDSTTHARYRMIWGVIS